MGYVNHIKLKNMSILACLTLSTVLLAACVSGGGDSASRSLQPNVTDNSNVPLPGYKEGTKFIYSNGTWLKVVNTSNGLVEWVDHRGSTSISRADFTYRNLNWQNRKTSGSRNFKPIRYLFDSPPDSLWPLKKGKVASYDEKGVWVDEDGVDHSYNTFWRCEVNGQEKVRVPAGDFDTWKLTCSRYPKKESYPGGLSWEDKSWNYAPSINHWVIEKQDYHGYKPGKRRELVAIIPDLASLLPRADLATVKKQFQNALEYKKSGTSKQWRSNDGRVSIAFTPRKSFSHGGGSVCRQYEQHLFLSEMKDTLYGVACRTNKGRWRIPRY